MVAGDFDGVAIGEDFVDAGHEEGPFPFIVEVVDHEEAAAVEVLAEAAGLGVGDGSVADTDGVEEGPVEHLVAVDIDNLFDGAGIDKG